MRYLTLALLLLGCGNADPDFYTQRGAKVYYNGLKSYFGPIEANEQEDWAAYYYQFYYHATLKEIDECIEGVEVNLQKDPECSVLSFDDACSGYYDGLNGEIWLYNPNCPDQVVYMHELIHRLQWCVNTEVDSNHSEEIWKDIGSRGRWFMLRCTPRF